MKRRFYPAALNVQGKRCCVIGADDEAAEKSARLAEAGAEVVLIWTGAPDRAGRLAKPSVDVKARPFQIDDITDQFLIVLTTKNDPSLTAAVAARCRKRRILLAALDQPDFCDVIHLSLFDRGRLRIGISTEGAAPGLARKIRQGLEASFDGVPIEQFLDHLAGLRERLEREIPDLAERRKALLAAVEGFAFKAEVTFPKDWRKERP